MNLVNQGSWYNIGMHLNYDIIRDGSVFHVRLGPDVQLSLTEVLSPGQWQVGCPCWKWGCAQWHVPSPMCCCNKILQSGGLTALETRSPRSRCHQGWFLERTLPLACGRPPSLLCPHRGWALFLSLQGHHSCGIWAPPFYAHFTLTTSLKAHLHVESHVGS